MEWNKEKRLMRKHAKSLTNKLVALEQIAWIVWTGQMLCNQYSAEILLINNSGKWEFKDNQKEIHSRNFKDH
jgi:hypothetical protein